MHLTAEELRLYQDRRLEGAALLDAGDHLATCAECRAKLDGSVPAAKQWIETVQNLSLTEQAFEQHVEYEQLAGYVDGRLLGEPLRQLMVHIDQCSICRAEIDDLRESRNNLKPGKTKPVGTVRVSWVWPAVAAAGLFAIAGMVLLQSPESPDRSAPAVASIRDAGQLIQVDAHGSLQAPAWLAAEDRQQVLTALRDGTLPARKNNLQTQPSTLLGPGQSQPALKLQQPLYAPVMDVRPEFRWQPVKGSTYRVEVFDSSYRPVASSSELREPSWTPEEPLQRGQVYSWQVTARTPNGTVRVPAPPEPEARFSVVGEQESSEIQKLRTEHPEAHLLLAVKLAAAGLHSDAQSELAALDAENPGSAVVARLKRSLP